MKEGRGREEGGGGRAREREEARDEETQTAPAVSKAKATHTAGCRLLNLRVASEAWGAAVLICEEGCCCLSQPPRSPALSSPGLLTLH